ncbi:Transposon Tf2-9 polyprotein [Trichinella murrelli]|uniref:Transposon Tf2-9 polyprotein n=1 Tax=Trichinella murrelli TaxID=144512 RepID=A0A0V0T6P8_9BILA|nr:Transposon Tf2-9 polyprotein [Trichinella murrelli]
MDIVVEYKMRKQKLVRRTQHKSCKCKHVDKEFSWSTHGRFLDVVSEGVGQYTSRPLEVIVDEDAKPKFLHHRQVPFALKSKVEGETVNPTIKTDVYSLPKISDVSAELAEEKLFTKLDLDRAYTKGIQTMNEKIRGMKNFRTPENRKYLEVFLVMLDFYERFLPNKSAVLEPPFQLLKKEVPWELKGKHAKSFEVPKKLLMAHNVLIRYSIDLPLILAGVALAFCVTAVLAHKPSNEIKAPISYGSRILQKSEKPTHS